MKGFSLAGLLRVRDLEEQRAAAELAEANGALDTVRAHRSRMRAALGGVGGVPGVGGVAGRSVDASALSAIVAARASAHTLLGELSSLHDHAAQTAADAHSAHHTARANARALEKLRVRHVEAETARELRAEQGALDEIAIQGWRTAEDGTR